MNKLEILSPESRQNLDNLMVEYPESISYVSISMNRVNPEWLTTSVSIHSNLPIDEFRPVLSGIPGLTVKDGQSWIEASGEKFDTFDYSLEGINVSVITPTKKETPQLEGATQENTLLDNNIVWDAESIMRQEG